jgi:hypothetical protein
MAHCVANQKISGSRAALAEFATATNQFTPNQMVSTKMHAEIHWLDI